MRGRHNDADENQKIIFVSPLTGDRSCSIMEPQSRATNDNPKGDQKMKYTVVEKVTMFRNIEIEASSEQEAREKWELAMFDESQCGEWEPGDDFECLIVD